MTDARADAAATMQRITPLRHIMANDLQQLEPFDAVSLISLLLRDTLRRFGRPAERLAALGALASLIAGEPDA